MYTQQQIYSTGGTLDILELDSAEESNNWSQVYWGKICCDVCYTKCEGMFDLPVVFTQENSVGKGVPLLRLLASHLEMLCDW